MGKDLPGLSPLWLISLALVLGVFLATALPLVVLTKDALPGDWLGFAGAIIGAGCTIFAGWLAYSAVQVQIKDYRDAARQTAFSALVEQVMTNSRDIDRLVLAAAFLNTFAEPFPPTRQHWWLYRSIAAITNESFGFCERVGDQCALRLWL